MPVVDHERRAFAGDDVRIEPDEAAGTRLVALDILRGVALLGILVANIEYFAGPELLNDIPLGYPKPPFVGWHASLDQAIVVGKWLFVEGKMRGLFALLFGAGAVLLTERIERRSSARHAAAIFYRRNLWLLCFGLLHGFLLYLGDILVDYAVLGLIFLFPLRKRSARLLVSLGMVVWIFGGTAGSFRAFDILDDLHAVSAGSTRQERLPRRPSSPADASIEAARSAVVVERVRVGQLDYTQDWKGRAAREIAFLKFKFLSGLVLQWLGAMIVGMGLYKSGFLINRRPLREQVVVALIGYAIAWPIVLLGWWKTWQAGLTVQAQDIWMQAPYNVQMAAGTLANASLLLIAIRRGWLRGAGPALAAVGRMAFTNYILTSLLCGALFWWSPLKLYGRLEYYQAQFVVVAVWFVLILFSGWWLRRFSMGPLEWVWRWLTYGQRPAFRLSRG